MRRIKQAAGKTFDSGFSTPGMFNRTVIFQLRLLLGYAALVHSGFFLLGLIFFRSPFMIYHAAIVLGFFLFSKYIHIGNFILIYCLTFVEIGVHSYILYWFLGSMCAIELYYLLLIPVIQTFICRIAIRKTASYIQELTTTTQRLAGQTL